MSTDQPPPSSGHGPVAHASYWILGVVSFVCAALDLGTKHWAKANLEGYDPATLGPKKLELIPGYLQFVFAQNPGGAWSFLRSLHEVLRRPFFLFVSAAAIVFIVSVYGRIDRRHWALVWGLPLALGGAIGNLVDRMRYGWVIDFVDFYVVRDGREMHWPTYNVADVFIVVGVGMMGVDMVLGLGRGGGSRASDERPAPAPSSDGSG